MVSYSILGSSPLALLPRGKTCVARIQCELCQDKFESLIHLQFRDFNEFVCENIYVCVLISNFWYYGVTNGVVWHSSLGMCRYEVL